MSVENFKPEIWSRELLYSLKKNLVGTNLVNRNYQGDIANEGDIVRITTPSAINTDDYTGADITFQTITSSQQTLEIDQAKYFGYTVDDVDQAQANVALLQSYMQEASYSLGNVADTFIFESYTEADAANVIDDATFDSTDAYDTLTEAAARLSEANVPEQGRWAVLSPREFKALSNDDAFQRASDLGDETSRFGFQGMAAGFSVWMSNNLVTDSTTRYSIFGHNMAITFADQIIKMEAGRHEAKFADFMKGLHVYGKKVVRPTALGVIEIPLGS